MTRKTTPNHTPEKLKGNIKNNYLYTFLYNFNLTSGVWMIYLAYKGLTLFEIGIMEAIFHLTSFTMEVPTGIVADLLGRRTSRILGRLMAVVATLMMIFSNGPLGFAVSFIFSALSYNLESGAGDALVYDSMKELGNDKGYMKVKGRYEVIIQLTGALALPIGGYLATLDYAMVYQGALVIATVTVLHSFTFIEPSVGRVEKKDSAWATFSHQFKDSFNVIRNSRRLAFLIVMAESFAVFVTTTFFYIQNYMKMNGYNEFRIGMILAGGSVLSALTASQAHRFERRFGYKKTLVILLAAGVFFLWLMVTDGFSVIGFIGLSMSEAMEFVIMSDYINRLIPSKRRATVLSMQSMVFSFFMILLFPMVGFVGDAYGLRGSFGMIAAISTLISMVMAHRVIRDKSETALDAAVQKA